MMTNRSSACEWPGSGIVNDNGSANTVAASSKLTPCFARFDLALSSSPLKTQGHGRMKFDAAEVNLGDWNWQAASVLCAPGVRRPKTARTGCPAGASKGGSEAPGQPPGGFFQSQGA